MDYQAVTVWSIIKRFLIGWAVAGVLLVLISCARHKEFIISAFTDYTWAMLNAVMPIVLLVIAIAYITSSLFR